MQNRISDSTIQRLLLVHPHIDPTVQGPETLWFAMVCAYPEEITASPTGLLVGSTPQQLVAIAVP